MEKDQFLPEPDASNRLVSDQGSKQKSLGLCPLVSISTVATLP
jgi:hypothetical protein